MFFIRLFILVFVLLPGLKGFAEPNKQALKYIREKAYDRAEEQILKSLDKDSINPAGHYLAGLLHVQPAYSQFQIDTAYFHVLLAGRQWELTEEKDQQRFIKIGISQDSIALLRTDIELLAYQRAVEAMNLDAFSLFFSEFDNDSLDVLLTITRDSLAFSNTSQVNIWQGYKQFFEKYPESKQASEANDRYHRLIFEEKANNKSAEAIENFLKEVADTPFRAILEKQLLLHYTVSNSPKSYLNFIKKYPSSPSRTLAVNALYHLSKKDDDFTFPDRLVSDSLAREKTLEGIDLLPFLKEDKYGFFSANNGQIVIQANLDAIDDQYLCGVSNDVLLKVSSQGNQYLMNRTGKLVRENIADFKLLTNGIVAIESAGKFGCMLVSGELILPMEYDNIEMVGLNYLKAEKDGKMFLFSFLGKRLLSGAYDEITFLGGDLITISDNGKMALFNLTELTGDFIDENELLFIYDEVETFDQKYVLGFSGEAETLLNFSLEELIPLGIHEIYVEGVYVYTKSKWGYKLFDTKENLLKVDLYQEVQTGVNKLGIKKNDSWNLFIDNMRSEPVLNLDSIFFLTDNATITVKSGVRSILYDNGATVPLKAGQSVGRMLSSLGKVNTDYLLLNNEKNLVSVISPQGKSLFEFDGSGAEQILDSVFLLKTKKGMRLVDEQGENILSRTYELIEPELQRGRVTLHLLDKGKLGIYHPEKDILISPKYLQKLDLLSDTTYLTTKESGAGIINTRSSSQVSFEYEEIRFLNDTLILVREEGVWSLLNIYSDEILLSDIIQLDSKLDYGTFQQIKFRQAGGYGLLDSRYGIFLPGDYNEIVTLKGSDESVYFFAERFLADSAFYIVLYINEKGEKIRSIAYRESEYDNILCEN